MVRSCASSKEAVRKQVPASEVQRWIKTAEVNDHVKGRERGERKMRKKRKDDHIWLRSKGCESSTQSEWGLRN